MKLDVINHGSAVVIEGAVLRVKDLLPADELALGGLRLERAETLGDGRHELIFQHGQRRVVDEPSSAAPRRLVIRRARQLLTMEGDGIGLREHATVLCEGGRISAILDRDEPFDVEGAQMIDAADAVVTPGLVDPHTHPVFAGERSIEFGLKAAGASYLDIHSAGGGIHSTVEATRAASFEQLETRCCEHLTALLRWGVTTCEGKSGYALSTPGELRLLEVLRAVGGRHPVDVVPTLLGAHTLPKGRDRAEYVAEVIEEMIPLAAQRQLARFCDAYCEDGAFTPDEVERIFAAAKQAGLGLRLHAEQFTDQGGAALAARLGAASADHLEAISDTGIAALAAAKTTAVLLPGAALTCRSPWPPAAALLEAGVPVALGTDLNPGSSMTAALPLMMSLACMQMFVDCEQAWRGVTIEAARSLGRDDIGRLAPGCAADLAIFAVPNYRTVPYHYGENHLKHVIKRGHLVL